MPQRPLIQGNFLIIVLTFRAILKERPTCCYAHFIDEKRREAVRLALRHTAYQG